MVEAACGVVDRPEGPVESFDGFGVEVFYGLFVAPAHTVSCAGVAIEGVDGFCYSHLRSRHC